VTFDVSKLSPAPFVFDERVRSMAVYCGPKVGCFDELQETVCYIGWGPGDPAWDLDRRRADWALLALARNALDVQLRRGWHAARTIDFKWYVPAVLAVMTQRQYDDGGADALYQSDPYTAILKANVWFVANVESAPGG
jgi:hypothetical protein